MSSNATGSDGGVEETKEGDRSAATDADAGAGGSGGSGSGGGKRDDRLQDVQLGTHDEEEVELGIGGGTAAVGGGHDGEEGSI